VGRCEGLSGSRTLGGALAQPSLQTTTKLSETMLLVIARVMGTSETSEVHCHSKMYNSFSSKQHNRERHLAMQLPARFQSRYARTWPRVPFNIHLSPQTAFHTDRSIIQFSSKQHNRERHMTSAAGRCSFPRADTRARGHASPPTQHPLRLSYRSVSVIHNRGRGNLQSVPVHSSQPSSESRCPQR
jgi:hypothetical protein